MKIYQHKHTKVFMSQNDYNHLSTREKDEMVLYNSNYKFNKMTNETKQTTLELFAIALYEKGLLKGNGDEIQALLQEHKEIDMRQHLDTWLQGRVEMKRNFDVISKGKTFEEFWEETYGGNK